MEKKIEDYLHLYLGCKVYIKGEITKGMFDDGQEVDIIGTLSSVSGNYWGIDTEHGSIGTDKAIFKLLLRPLTDITEEEMFAFFLIYCPKEQLVEDNSRESMWVGYFGKTEAKERVKIKLLKNIISLTPIETVYLVSKGFDLFGLIESGLAIDLATLN